MVVETSAQVHLVVTSWPDEPESPEIYVAGSFNSWQPGDELFRMQRTADGFVLIFLFAERMNSSSHVVDGIRWRPMLAERRRQPQLIRRWRNPGAALPAGPMVCQKPPVLNDAIIVHEMKAPFLATYKNIRICLPEGYADDTTHYPVIYMMDGQNLFDDATSYAGEWGVDEALQAHMAAGRSEPSSWGGSQWSAAHDGIHALGK